MFHGHSVINIHASVPHIHVFCICEFKPYWESWPRRTKKPTHGLLWTTKQAWRGSKKLSRTLPWARGSEGQRREPRSQATPSHEPASTQLKRQEECSPLNSLIQRNTGWNDSKWSKKKKKKPSMLVLSDSFCSPKACSLSIYSEDNNRQYSN